MSAEILRRAAALMRERAEGATQPVWAEWHMVEDGRAEVFVPNGTMSTETVFEFKDHIDCEECIRPSEADLLHIASWHPAVALAVADWLDCVAAPFDQMWEADEDGILWSYDLDGDPLRFEDSQDSLALAVARAYLGETS